MLTLKVHYMFLQSAVISNMQGNDQEATGLTPVCLGLSWDIGRAVDWGPEAHSLTPSHLHMLWCL